MIELGWRQLCGPINACIGTTNCQYLTSTYCVATHAESGALRNIGDTDPVKSGQNKDIDSVILNRRCTGIVKIASSINKIIKIIRLPEKRLESLSYILYVLFVELIPAVQNSCLGLGSNTGT